MGSVSAAARVTAAAVAIGVTLSIVWSMAAVAHPAGAEKNNAPAHFCAGASGVTNSGG